MNLLKRIFWSDRCLHTLQGINIGLGIAFIATVIGMCKEEAE